MNKATTNDFFDEWAIYDQVLDHNSMHHDEIYRDVQRVLADRYNDRPFALLDLGCSDVALHHAARNLAGVGWWREFRRGDLLDGLRTGLDKFDLIFTSFALHHLTSAQKSVFFRSAYERLSENGMLLLIDTMRDDGEDRELYLDRYCAWLRSECKTLSEQARDLLCAHIRDNDFPETGAALDTMATCAGFSPHVEVSSFRWHHAWAFTLKKG